MKLLMKQSSKVLKPITAMTKVLSGEKYPAGRLLFPIVMGLLEYYSDATCSEELDRHVRMGCRPIFDFLSGETILNDLYPFNGMQTGNSVVRTSLIC